MKQFEKPYFVIKKNLQKSQTTGIFFSDQLSNDVLQDVCLKITGKEEFSIDYVENDYEDEFFEKTYNKGRLAILFYNGVANYVSFSEKEIGGRNSSVQSVPTAFNLFYLNPHEKKKLFYYFLNFSGNAATDYQLTMYRLMKTIGFNFLNCDDKIKNEITSFVSVDDVMNSKKINTGKNSSNNSSYITKSGFNDYEIYGKTYGANKYDTSITCYALSILADKNQKITLYEVVEKDLKELPKSSLDVLIKMGNIKVVPTDMRLEKKAFQENNSLRSPRYVFNLFEKLGKKKCALCDCQIPELVQGAHVWSVASIKKSPLSDEKKIESAIDGDNGIWLCENHHKLFDENIIFIDKKLSVQTSNKISSRDAKFVNEITTNKILPKFYHSAKFIKYLNERNQGLKTIF